MDNKVFRNGRWWRIVKAPATPRKRPVTEADYRERIAELVALDAPPIIIRAERAQLATLRNRRIHGVTLN